MLKPRRGNRREYEGVVVNDRLTEVLVATGFIGEETASNIARTLDKVDRGELIAALNGDQPAGVGTVRRFASLLGDVETSGHRAPFVLLRAEDLNNMKPPEYVLPGVIPKGALACLFAPPERFKTFIGLDMSLSIATGGRWLGRYETTPGEAIYVLAEGSSGLQRRVAAWADYSNTEATGYFVIEAVPLMDDLATLRFIDEVHRAASNPALIVFDTLARCMTGGDENSARDMGLVIANADRVREATGAAVLLIHHTGKSGDRERGSSALRGACDTMLKVVGDRDKLVLRCEKQKDAPHFSDIPIRFLPHLESGVITARIGVDVNDDGLTSNQLQILESLSSALEPGGLPTSKWFAVAERSSGTFYRARKVLHDKGFVFADKVGRGAYYSLTEKGEEALTTKPPLTANGGGGSNAESLPPAPPSLEGA